jgi:heme exporter protein B
MRTFRLFFAFLYWDALRELRHKASLPNMALFSILVLFVGQLGVGTDPEAVRNVGPVVFWIAVLFSGTVGLSQSFAAERDGGVLAGILSAPVDLGVYYLSKVASTWLQVLAMEVVSVGVYVVLFDAAGSLNAAALFCVLAILTLAYMAIGVVLAAMTTSLARGGEVLLRIVLLPLMIPLLGLTLRVSQGVFGAVIAGGTLGPSMDLGSYAAVGLAFCGLYLAAGFLLFPKVIEE